MANFLYLTARQGFSDGTHRWKASGGDTFKVMLLTQSYAPSPAHAVVAEIAAHEAVGAGYAGGFGGAGRLALSGYQSVLDPVALQVQLKASPLTWPLINVGLITGVAIIKELTSDADSLVIAWIDQGFPVVTNGGNWTLEWADVGVLVSL